jgi:hypothetical protein
MMPVDYRFDAAVDPVTKIHDSYADLAATRSMDYMSSTISSPSSDTLLMTRHATQYNAPAATGSNQPQFSTAYGHHQSTHDNYYWPASVTANSYAESYGINRAMSITAPSNSATIPMNQQQQYEQTTDYWRDNLTMSMSATATQELQTPVRPMEPHRTTIDYSSTNYHSSSNISTNDNQFKPIDNGQGGLQHDIALQADVAAISEYPTNGRHHHLQQQQQQQQQQYNNNGYRGNESAGVQY